MNPNRYLFAVAICFAVILKGLAQNGTLKSYNNYDFVPGDHILFEDDFSDSQIGEFPARWDLVNGQGAVSDIDVKRAFFLTDGNYGSIKPLMKTENYLTDSFTVEFDFIIKDGAYEPLMFLYTPDEAGRFIGWAHNVHTNYFDNDLSGTYPEDEENFNNHWHHAAFAYKNGQMKCYLDQYRVLVIPRSGFQPESIRFGGIGSNESPLIFTNVRIATGGGMNMLGKLITDGKWIARGITFDVNKASIRPESMGTLNMIARTLKEKPEMKVEIGGYTDSDGDDAANQKLSEQRAESVKSQLVTMGIDAARLTTKGYGETNPADSNATPEGKANNRRVELKTIH